MLVKSMSKLFLAGEYAVLRPGSYAIIAPVEKYTYLDIEKNEEEIIISPIEDKSNILYNSRKVAFEFCKNKENFIYKYSTQLYSGDKKFGLGSSASVCVVTIKAILNMMNIGFTKKDLFNLSVKALRLSGINGSMGDVACIVYEELILYRNSYDVKRINPKKILNINAYWTKKEASTSSQIKKLDLNSDKFIEFSKKSDEYTLSLYHSIEMGDRDKLFLFIEKLKNNLEFLESFTNIEIHNKKIYELIIDKNFKTSGAGKGDFVISMDLGDKYEKGSTYKICFRE